MGYDFVRRKVKWKRKNVYGYGGDGEYAGSFEEPDFVNIQRAEGGECVVAKHAETGHWYWFRQDDTLLPWARMNDMLMGACECHEGRRRSFLSASSEGPFATEEAAKRFGENHERQNLYERGRQKKASKRFEAARKALAEVLKHGIDSPDGSYDDDD